MVRPSDFFSKISVHPAMHARPSKITQENQSYLNKYISLSNHDLGRSPTGTASTRPWSGSWLGWRLHPSDPALSSSSATSPIGRAFRSTPRRISSGVGRDRGTYQARQARAGSREPFGPRGPEMARLLRTERRSAPFSPSRPIRGTNPASSPIISKGGPRCSLLDMEIASGSKTPLPAARPPLPPPDDIIELGRRRVPQMARTCRGRTRKAGRGATRDRPHGKASQHGHHPESAAARYIWTQRSAPMTTLTPEQRQAVERAEETPVRVEDPETHTTCVFLVNPEDHPQQAGFDPPRLSQIVIMPR